MMPQENPFFYNLPAQNRDFVGRWAVVEEITADLCRARADSWAIIGGRRFGKSSLLKAIEARLTCRLAECNIGDRWVFPLLVDLKRCKPDSEEHVYTCILHYLGRSLRRRRRQLSDLASVNMQAVAKTGYEPLTFFQFEDALEDLARQVDEYLGSFRLVLLLDEVEAMTNYSWSDILLNQLRAMIYTGPLASSIKLVLTGSANVIRARQTGSPLLNAVKIEHLALLSDEDLRSLIALGGEMPAEAMNIVREKSGGHPFIAQYLLHHAWDDGLEGVDSQKIERISCQMRQDRSADLEGWWDAIGDSGQWAYAALTTAQDWVNEQELLEEVQLADQSLDQGLSALCYHGLVKRDESFRHYCIAGKLFNDWFLLNGAKRLLEADSQPKDAQIIIEHLESIGAQTNIAGGVESVASGKFESATTFGDGDAKDCRSEDRSD